MKKWLLVIALCASTAVASATEPLSTEHERKQRIFDGVSVGDAITTIIGAGCVTVKEIKMV